MRKLWVVPLLALAVVAAISGSSPAVSSPASQAPRVGTKAQRDSVFRLYWAYFLRNPDDSGISYWVGRLDAGTNLEGISGSFAGSSEFQRRYGQLSNDAFVRLIYSNVFGRDVDAGGLAHWTGALNNGKSRGSVMVGFSESREYKRLTNTGPGLCDSPLQCSETLFGYWATGGQRARMLAGFVAGPSTVNYLFGLQYNAADDWTFAGCASSGGEVRCSATNNKGKTLSAIMHDTGAPYHIHGISGSGGTPGGSTTTTTAPPSTSPCTTPRKCSEALFGDWVVRDRTAALKIASASAVDYLFGLTYHDTAGWVFTGCEATAGFVHCTATRNDGKTLTMAMPGDSVPYFITSVSFG